MEVKFEMITRQKSYFWSLQAAQAQYFLLPILINGLSEHMLSVEYRTIFIYHLMIILFSTDEQGRPIARRGWAMSPGLIFFGAQNTFFLFVRRQINCYIH
jgi:hypothetical protein